MQEPCIESLDIPKQKTNKNDKETKVPIELSLMLRLQQYVALLFQPNKTT